MILLTGGSGLLGSEIVRLRPDIFHPMSSEFNILDPNKECLKNVDLIVHCAAFTDVDKAEDHKSECYELNVIGTKNISSFWIPILYISTNSVFDGFTGNYSENDIPNPVNFYSLTKLLGEFCLNNKSKIVRTSFRKTPWEYESAYEDRFTSADYVDVTAKEIVKAIEIFDRLPSIIHIGSKRRSFFELAKETRPEVTPMIFKELFPKRPVDVSLNCSLWESISK